MKVFGLWERLTKIVFFKGKQVAIDPATQTGAADKVISIPDMAAGATQEMVLTTQAQTLTNKTISGADNTLQAIPGASLNNDSVTASKLDPTTVAGLGLVMTDTGAGVDRLDVNPDGSTLEINADALRIKDSGVTEAKIQTGAVTVNKIGANAVTAAKLNADVAGAGLVLGTGNALEVLPDNITLALNGDTVQVKAQGVDTAQLKDSAVTNAKIANATIELGKMAAVLGDQNKVLKRQDSTGAVIAGNEIPNTGTVLTDSALNNNVVLKTLDRLQNYSTQVSITGASTELFVNSRVGVVEILTCASGTINQIMVENTDAAHLVILNRTGAPILIDNDVGASAGRRIITGTGGPINLADKAALFLVYNANPAGALNRWTVVGGTGGGAGGTVTQVTTAAPHGFTNASDKGKVLYLNGSTYTAAIATAANTAEVVGILANVIDSDTFELATGGAVEVIEGNDFDGGSVPAIGEAVFLSASEAGKMTAVEPTTVGYVSKPLGIIFATNKMFFYNMRGTVVGGANLRTQIGLANNTTTNIQNVTAYTAGEIAGWVYIDATTDLRFYVQAQFVKDAANAWKVAFQTTGDTPPQGFKIDVATVASVDYLQVTMPNVAGFNAATSNINFALNAPAVGATLPLQIASTSVSFTDIQAASSAGITFKEDGGTAVGSVSDAGAWTLGPSNTANTNQINGVLRVQSSSTTGGLRFAQSSSTSYIQTIGTDTSTNGRLQLYSYRSDFSNEILTGDVSSAGAWTLGISGANIIHLIQGTSADNDKGILDIRNFSATDAAPGCRIGTASTTDSTANKILNFLRGSSAAGAVVANGAGGATFGAYSDVRLKENFRPLESQLDKLLALNLQRYDLKSGSKNCVGITAQDMQKVFPESVSVDESTEEKLLMIGGWEPTTFILVKAIQELSAKNDALEARLAALENK